MASLVAITAAHRRRTCGRLLQPDVCRQERAVISRGPAHRDDDLAGSEVVEREDGHDMFSMCGDRTQVRNRRGGRNADDKRPGERDQRRDA